MHRRKGAQKPFPRITYAPKKAEVAVSNESPRNVCPKCGGAIKVNAKFCTSCGAEMVKNIVNAAENVGRLINGIMEFTSQAPDNPGEMVISSFKPMMKF